VTPFPCDVECSFGAFLKQRSACTLNTHVCPDVEGTLRSLHTVQCTHACCVLAGDLASRDLDKKRIRTDLVPRPVAILAFPWCSGLMSVYIPHAMRYVNHSMVTNQTEFESRAFGPPTEDPNKALQEPGAVVGAFTSHWCSICTLHSSFSCLHMLGSSAQAVTQQ
jgi:hypothetical protein